VEGGLIMRRGFFIFLGIIVTVVTVTNALASNVTPTLSNAGTMPVVVKRAGDFVTIGVTASTTGNNHIKNVKATVTGGGTQKIIMLDSHGFTQRLGYYSGYYEKQFFVQPNRTSQDIPYSVSFEASDDAGNIATLAGQSFIVEAEDRIAPKILSFTVTPMTFDYTGGKITASVRASDDVGVKQVRVYLTRPDGSKGMTGAIAQVGGTVQDGEWKHSWTLWSNTTATPQVWGIQVMVSDGTNTTNSRTISVTVPIKPTGSGSPKKPTALPKY
jgi:hypothetical protein